MRLALLQPPYPTATSLPAASCCIAWLADAVQQAAKEGADLILLPEYATAPGLTDADMVAAAAGAAGAELTALCSRTAREAGCLVGLGTVAILPERPRNRTLLFGRDGETLLAYDKVHLTRAEREDLGMLPGGMPAVAVHGGLRIAAAVCLDVYFPEYIAALAGQGVDLILSPSYQRSETAERLRLISACRAFDAGAWLARSAYAMPTPGLGGHTLVAAPDGAIVADAGTEPGILHAAIEPSRKCLRPACHGRPAAPHAQLVAEARRPDLYRPRPERQAAVLDAAFPRICAHRGLSEACPENTLPAFAAAIALPGVHEIEMDLWLSADGVPVVCHDLRVDRTTGGAGAVTEMTWDCIRKLDAGGRLGPAWEGVRIPRFEEVLDLAEGRVGLNIHIKDPGPDGLLVRLVADLLRRRGMDRLGYLSGDERVLAAACRLAPDLERCCLAHQKTPRRQIEVAVQHGCRRLQFYRCVTAEDAALAAAHGLVRNLFWSDEVEDARGYAARGIDVILTNRAHRLAGRLAPG